MGINSYNGKVLNAILYGIATLLDLPTLIINLFHLSKLKDQMKLCEETKKKEIEEYEKIENAIAKLSGIFEKNNERFIPENIISNQ